jgi:hypothetical protein
LEPCYGVGQQKMSNSVGAALRHRPTGHRTLLEPRCGVGQRDEELRWSRVAASANGT